MSAVELKRQDGFAYREAIPVGEATGDPVVLVHGFPESSRMWEPLMAELAASGHRCVAPDLYGLGDSTDGYPATFEHNLETFATFVSRLDLGPVVLVVHDWGGFVGLAWACDHPGEVTALVISNTGFFSDGRWHGMADAIRGEQGEAIVAAIDRDGFIALLRASGTAFDEADIDAYWKPFQDGRGQRATLDFFRSMAFVKLDPWQGKLAELGVPTLILWGADDQFAPVAAAHRFAREIPGSKLVVFEAVGHFVFDEAPDRSTAEVIAFLGSAAHHQSGRAAGTADEGPSYLAAMGQAAIDADAFNAFEARGWEEKAAGYDRFFGGITGRLVEPLLDAAAVGAGTRMLDLATGPGYAAARAADRGASVVGVDVAMAMISLARRLHPGLDFRQADAHALPLDDASFDVVVGNFLILHLGRPEQAMAEFVRVLRPGGMLTLTTWDLPERAQILGIFLDAVAEAGATPPEDLPAGPDFFRFSVDEEFDALLREHGLEDPAVRTVAFTHDVATADELWTGLLGGTVRTSALIVRQPAAARRRIREAFNRLVRRYQRGDVLELPVSVKLATGRKPDQQ